MMRLRDIPLKATYHKGKDDIAREFYLPCMATATRYDRAVGFFSSTIYTIAWPSLRSFVERGGKMRVICSPALQNDDIDALERGYSERALQAAATNLQTAIAGLLADTKTQKPATILASLVALGVLEVKLAFVGTSGERRLYHDKVGLVHDGFGDQIAFKGSMNETWSGLSADGNLESVDVFVSWDSPREAERVRSETEYFESLWENRYSGVEVSPFPDVAKDALLSAADVQNWTSLADELVAQSLGAAMSTAEELSPRRTPRQHQSTALANWNRNGRKGILEHATGSGKTFTAICAIEQALALGNVPLILVPSELLLTQWEKEVRTSLNSLAPSILLCGAGNTQWKDALLLQAWTRPRVDNKPRIVISTLQTAIGEQFRDGLIEGDHLFVVSDEVHRMGSTSCRKLFTIASGPRLGLSATPRRSGDPEGTDALMSYFGGILEPPYSLQDAINDGVLTPYMYYVHRVTLDDAEQAQWDELTSRIRILFARLKGDTTTDAGSANRLKTLILQRARIIRGAGNKIPLAVSILSREVQPNQKWLVYCDSIEQLSALRAALTEKDIPASEYYAAMTGDRESTLKHFELNGGILLSIRCLDEGVDIPSVTHALILASSQNPREFIQRRGRILRKAPGKSLAFLHDAIVIPRDTSGEAPDISVTQRELLRAVEFGKTALNPSAVTELERIALAYSLNLELEPEVEDADDE
jgi:superfamily II DNA or RNA helicase